MCHLHLLNVYYANCFKVKEPNASVLKKKKKKRLVNIHTPTPCNEVTEESLKVPQQYPTLGSAQKLRDIYNNKKMENTSAK